MAGACYDSDMNVIHDLAYSIDELHKFHGSKYSQSNTGNIYRDVRDLLNKNKLVLFSGMPCQVAALYGFLGAKPENLITMDLICYGIPSPLLFSNILEFYQKQEKCKVTDYHFRDKQKFGWSHTTEIYFENGKRITNIYPRFDLFYRLWNTNTLRESCYSCKFVGKSRIADFTVGNYWGIEALSKAFDASKGVSAVLLNNDKSKALFEQIKHSFIFERESWESLLVFQHGLKKNYPRPESRDHFYTDLSELGVVGCANKYNPPNKVKKLIISLPHSIQSILSLPFKIKSIKSGVRF